MSTDLQFGASDPVDDGRGQAPLRGPHIAVQGLRMVVDTRIQQQDARRETLLSVDNVEVLERHLPFFVQRRSP